MPQTEIDADELRAQFNALNDKIEAKAAQIAALTALLSQYMTAVQVQQYVADNTSRSVATMPPPAFNIGNPPTQAEVVAVGDFLGNLYSNLQG